MGQLIRREEIFAALLPTEVTRRTGCSIDHYNEGMVLE
jgi:hypothetical protein